MLEELCLRVRALCENTLTLISAWRENGPLPLTVGADFQLRSCPRFTVP